MDWGEFINRNLEETYDFYERKYKERFGDSDQPRAISRFINGTIRNEVYKNRFLLYGELMSLPFKSSLIASAILSVFDNGRYDNYKWLALKATTALYVLSLPLGGIFWAKLGSGELLKEAWKKSKAKTSLRILAATAYCGPLSCYYLGHYATNVSQRAICSTLEKLCEMPDPFGAINAHLIDLSQKVSNALYSICH